MPSRKKKGKRNREPVDPPTGPLAPKTHIAAKATVRDAIVAFGESARWPRGHLGVVAPVPLRPLEGYGVLPVPVERRIARYLREERFYAVGGKISLRNSNDARSCFSLDVEAGAWVAEAPMLECRSGHCVAVLRRQLWAVGGPEPDPSINMNNSRRSCEYLDEVTNAWVRGPDMRTDRSDFGLGVLNEELWVVGGWSEDKGARSCERLDAVTGTWVPGPDMLTVRDGHCVAVLNGELWAVGGKDTDDEELVSEESCERLDATSNQWVAGHVNRT